MQRAHLCCCGLPAAAAQVPPPNANRMVDAARGVLNQLLADVFIFTDAMSGAATGASPGYGITLVAETTSGCLLSAEACATLVRALWRGACVVARRAAAGRACMLRMPTDERVPWSGAISACLCAHLQCISCLLACTPAAGLQGWRRCRR